MSKSIALLGEYTPTFPPHASTNAAIEHSRKILEADISADWVSTVDVEPKLFERYSGIWVAPGSPYKDMEKTLWAMIYGSLSATEHYYCNFGVNPDCIRELKQGPLNISGSDIEGEVRVIEYPGHPFFIGTLFVPQMRSTPESPHPLVTAFWGAVMAANTALNTDASPNGGAPVS
ncbi:MAG: CTP synthase [Acidithiobacillus sp.]